MKKELWMGYTGTLKGYNASSEDTFFGYIEVEEPKKTVTKTVTLFDEWSLPAESIRLQYPVIPVGAKNVRILFDVEE